MKTFDFGTIRFRPYSETGEFVIVGVMAFNPEGPHFDFQLGAMSAPKIARMFPALPGGIYRKAVEALEAELESITLSVATESFPGAGRDIFHAITSPREGVFTFHPGGRMLAPSMSSALEWLWRKFVDRRYVGAPLNPEGKMGRRLGSILFGIGLLPSYERNAKIGPEIFQVPFPIAKMMENGRAEKALRGLNLDLRTPTDIYNHGDEWLQRLRRLNDFGHGPGACLIAYRKPASDDGMKTEAFQAIAEEFKELGVTFVDESDASAVIDFARR